MNRIRLVRERRPFAIWDILVYGLLIIFIAALFFVFVLTDVFHTKDANGIQVELHGETIYTYTFGQGGKISAGWQDKIEEREEGDVLLVRITTEDGWNELAINDEAGTAVMHDADCSFRKDCTVMRAIGDGGSVITCIPHALKVLPLKGEDYSTPSIG